MACKILVVEDNLHIQENMVEILEMSYYEVHTANNGKEGLEKAVKITPDLILCDIQMPVMDGYQFLETIRKIPALSKVRFVFFTSSGEKKDVRRGLDMGADEYLVKPFSGEELLKVVEKQFG